MKKLFKFSALIFAVAVMFWGCKALSESDKVVKEFYDDIKAEKYDAFVSLLDTAALTANPAKEWTELASGTVAKIGKLKSYSQTSFNTSIKDGVTKTVLDYTVQYENNTTYDRIVVVKRGTAYKILRWEFNTDKSKLEDVK
jgi:hypothetical protein